jgi:hypothetical protein
MSAMSMSVRQILSKAGLEPVAFIQVGDRVLFAKAKNVSSSAEYVLVVLDLPVIHNDPEWDIVTDPNEYEVMNDRHPLDPALRVGLMMSLDRSMVGFAVETLGEIRMLGFDYGPEFKVPGTFRVFEKYFRLKYFEAPASVLQNTVNRIAAKSNQPVAAYLPSSSPSSTPSSSSSSSDNGMTMMIHLVVRLSDLKAKPVQVKESIQLQRSRIQLRLKQLADVNVNHLLSVQRETAQMTNKVSNNVEKIINAIQEQGSAEHYIETMRVMVLLRNELVLTTKHLQTVLDRIEERIGKPTEEGDDEFTNEEASPPPPSLPPTSGAAASATQPPPATAK